VYNHTLYLLFWAFNSAVVLFVSTLFPEAVVLGNFRFTPTESALYSGFWMTVILWAMWDFVHAKGVSITKTAGAFWVFFAMNFVAVWLVSRFSHIAGLGIVSFAWALLIALIANLVQRIVFEIVTARQ